MWVVGARGDDSDVVLVANLDGVRRDVTIEVGVKTVTVGVEPLSSGRIALDH